MSDYGTDFMTSYSPIENVTVDHMNAHDVVAISRGFVLI